MQPKLTVIAACALSKRLARACGAMQRTRVCALEVLECGLSSFRGSTDFREWTHSAAADAQGPAAGAGAASHRASDNLRYAVVVGD